jgi:outer membrane immunogenic protein
MRRLLLSTTALALFVAPAIAADMPVKAPAVAVAPVSSWTGLYLGGHAGGAWGRSRWDSDFNCAVGILCDPIDHSPRGWVGGLQAGYRLQSGPIVFGAEVTYAWSNIRATDNSTCTPGVNTCIGVVGGFDVHNTTKLRNLYTATGQIGYSWDRTLLYGKGGWAGGRVVRSSDDTLGVPAATFFGEVVQNASGWTAGGGFEYLWASNISFGVEYDYFRLSAGGFQSAASSGTGAFAFQWNANSVRLELHQVVARVNFKLWGGPGAIVARY